jgi:hypothetical protein
MAHELWYYSYVFFLFLAFFFSLMATYRPLYNGSTVLMSGLVISSFPPYSFSYWPRGEPWIVALFMFGLVISSFPPFSYFLLAMWRALYCGIIHVWFGYFFFPAFFLFFTGHVESPVLLHYSCSVWLFFLSRLFLFLTGHVESLVLTPCSL